MSEYTTRTALLLGDAAMERLKKARVAVFGIGGVGGHAAEALARSGVGALDLIDNDVIAPSNLNRQLFATQSTIGMDKVEAARLRLADAAPDCTVRGFKAFFMPETQEQFDFTQYDYVVDAIDTVTGKIALVLCAQQAGVPVISSMGAGNKLHPELFEVSDIYKTSVCPLARVMRTELKKRGVKHLKVVYSKEPPLRPAPSDEQINRRTIPGSTAFTPSAVGLIIAAEVVRGLVES